MTAVWRNNDFGDRLITSIVHVTVEETLKGASQQSIDVEVEGGTIGSLTLRVSDLETFSPGERAVFYLSHSQRGTLVPHLRGLGRQKIDQAGRIRGSTPTSCSGSELSVRHRNERVFRRLLHRGPTHEFGHALGLGHSAVATATMYPSISTCSQQSRTLDPDDIAAVLSLYPSTATPPTPPTTLRIFK